MDKVKRLSKPQHYWNDTLHCEGCGRSNRMNPISLGRTQVEWLYRLQREWGGDATQRQMKLIGSEYATISWTTYFGLTEKPTRGHFLLSDTGRSFLDEALAVSRTVWMFNKQVRFRSVDTVTAADLLREGYKTAEQIVAENHALAFTAPAGVLAQSRQEAAA